MPATSRPLTTPILLTATALVLAVLGYVAFIFGGNLPSGGYLAIRIVSVVAAPALLAVAVALLLRRARPAARFTPWLFAGSATLGAVCILVFSLSFSAGVNDADAGRPVGTLGSLALPAAIFGVAFVGAALAILLSALLLRLGSLSRPVRLSLSILGGALGGVLAFFLLFSPSSTAMLAFGLLIALAMMARSRSRNAAADSSEQDAAAAPSPARRPATSLVRRMGALSLAILALAWGVGAAVGFSQAGEPAATTAMGLSAGSGQFAAIPLIIAVTAIGQSRAPQLPWRTVSAVPLIGVAAGSTVQLLAYSPGGSGLFAGAIIAGLGIGIWIALLVVHVVPQTWPVRVVLAIAVTAGGGLVWFTAVAASGAVVLAVPAVLLLFAGKAIVRSRRQPGVATAAP